MKIKKLKVWILAIIFISACSTGINIFTDNDEVNLGKQFDSEIRKNTKEYPIYDNQEVKEYIDKNIFREILKSPEIKKRDVYNYQIEIIKNDSILNAFALPGGYIYLYTGLLKYLDSEAALAGVIGHEIAHVERRHATQRITASYGISIILSIALGENPSQLAELAANLFSGLALLANSRANEDESDEYSIKYLSSTRFYPGAVKFFFEKLRDDGLVSQSSSKIATFLSTHPDPLDRINTTENRLKALGITILNYKHDGESIFKESYKQNILNKLN
ncbi:MAG: M48 family metalloprotease [Melioribacter sp.]|uniref:M48 family metalloprotease n=1 Tax=Rosettibacter primus TaxID=3111523 RepID=UPI00247D2958|nr:M48 family metalloprotease [Melioribacter sp.]